MNHMSIIRALALAGGLAPLQLHAYTPPGLDLLSGAGPGVAVGLQGSFVFPQGDLRSSVNGRVGFQFGAHAALGTSEASEWRPRADYTRLDSGSLDPLSGMSTTTIQGVSLGLDHLSFLGAGRRGIYGLLGANVAWWHGQYAGGGATRETGPGFRAGLGNRFSGSFAMEMSLDLGRYRDSAGMGTSFRTGAFLTF